MLWPRSTEMEGVADPKKHTTFTRVTLPNVVSELKGEGLIEKNPKTYRIAAFAPLRGHG